MLAWVDVHSCMDVRECVCWRALFCLLFCFLFCACTNDVRCFSYVLSLSCFVQDLFRRKNDKSCSVIFF